MSRVIRMFVERLKLLRKARCVSQAEFAKELNVAQSTVGMWETGKREPDFKTLCRIASFFDVTSDYLLGLSDTPRPDFPMYKYDLQNITEMEANLLKMQDSVDRIKSMFLPVSPQE